jgi:membrane peptidoglycan carboxypeptidase
MSLLELTNAYAAFANRGFLPGRAAILEIRNADGNLLYQPPVTPQTQIFDPRVAWLISDILSDDNARMIGFGKNSTLKIERPAAVKTGTTTNYHDNWTVGYTPSLVVGVWVGNSDYQAMRDVNGLTGAAPIWQETIRSLLRGKPVEPFTRPDGLVQQEVCTYSGLLPTALCARSGLEWFLDGTQPTQPDNIYQQIWVRVATNLVPGPPSETRQPIIVLDLPVQAQRWAHSQGLRLLSDFTNTAGLPTEKAPGYINNAETHPATLLLISPLPGASYHISDRLERSTQQIPVEALIGPGVTNVTLWEDGQQTVSFRSPPYVTWWLLAQGSHRFWVQGLTADGKIIRSDTVEILVTK